MKDKPALDDITAWARLVRASNHVLGQIEAELKSAGFPPLSWYDVLLEIRRADERTLRPSDIQDRILLAQYNVSRLIDRLEGGGFVAKRKSADDGRSVLVTITDDGEALLQRMWPVYEAAIKRHFSDKLSGQKAAALAELLAGLLPDRSV
ncbi:MarR family winged helix-turn-helix transcriptional regulator [Roseibium sp.]|uniref:MarR family winged helix-turn-helix transcriptional regulator n=1 Tax=Roseibium sp. TaxID=1936156 RepID=UPI003A987E08